MKSVDAVWEKRNLGVSCKEIYIEMSDSMTDIRKYLDTVTEEYQVLFLPVQCSEWLIEVQEYGFQYIESNFDLIKKCKGQDYLPETYRKLLKHVSCKVFTAEEEQEFLENLRTKYFFEKDKISIDPYFSKEKSANRNYWRTMDYLEEKRILKFYEVYYGERPIGFFILEPKERGITEALLSGLYPECRETNLGACVMGEQTREAVRLGADLITMGVSLNNYQSLRVYQSLGYEIKRATNIFVKHRGEV